MKFLICAGLYLLIFIANTVLCNEDDFRKIDSIHQEELCSAYGGMCVIAADCPRGSLVEKSGLCPQQEYLGVECCTQRSVKDTRCKKLGVCLPENSFCSPKFIYPATDCPKRTKCCIMF